MDGYSHHGRSERESSLVLHNADGNQALMGFPNPGIGKTRMSGAIEVFPIGEMNTRHKEAVMKWILCLFGMFYLSGIPAKGEEITFSFQGTVHELDTEFYHFGGRPFEITYSFERTTKNANAGQSESGRYIGAIKSGSLTIYAEDKPYHWVIKPEGPDNTIEIKHRKDADTYSASASISAQSPGNEVPATFSVELIDDRAAALGDTSLPPSLKLSSFGSLKVVKFTFVGVKKNVFYAFGIITSAGTPAPQ
jgi:hypothetical protein